MNERDAFIAAVIANPADDMVRLAFADWLDEHDEPERAEFIRLQCKLAAFGPKSAVVLYHSQQERKGEECCVGRYGMCGYCSKRKREEELLLHEAKRLDWIKFAVSDSFRPFGVSGTILMPVPHRIEMQFRRGFVAEARCPLSVWMEHGPRLVREHPIESVRTVGLEPRQTFDVFAWFDLTFEPARLSNNELYAAWTVRSPIVPREVFLKLTQGTFPTREAAQAALSDALIAWAKSQQPVEVVK